MKALGFSYKGNMFQLEETTKLILRFGISIQKNSYADSYKISPSILICNPFMQSPKLQLFLLANLRREGIYLHEGTQSWWTLESLPEGLELLKRFAVPWFREWGNAALLAEKVEVAIRDHKHLIDAFEPLTPEQEEAIARVWPRPVDPNWRVPPRTYYYASILHYLAGDRQMAITRTQDWLSRLGPENRAEKDQAQVQLAALERIH